MMKPLRHITIAFSAALLLSPAGTAFAAQTPFPMPDAAVLGQSSQLIAQADNRRDRRRVVQNKQERRISASQAKRAAMSRNPGARYVNIQRRGDSYIVRLQQKNGRIIDVYVDARTGRVG